MSTHAVTVYFGRCEVCGKQSPFRKDHPAAARWEKNHLRIKHKIYNPALQKSKMAAVGPTVGGH
jgi:hypothetical protein